MGLGSIVTAILTGGASIPISKAISDKANKGPDLSSQPKPLPAAPDQDKAADAAQEQVKKRRARQTNTIFTDPLGLGGQANVIRKTLTGQ